jgi:tetratricopeptide (TPR) repeat protein
MAIHPITRALIATCILSAASFAQTMPAQNPPAAPCPAPNQTPDQAAKPCPPPAAKKSSAAEQFPFPGEPAKPANPPANVPDSPAPDSPSPSTTPSDAATQHPFPTQPPPKLPGDDSSSSSSRSPDDADPAPADDSATKGDPPEGTSVHRKLPKVKRVQTDDERVDEDLNVAKFYFRDENYQGAYLRAKDAINVQPDFSTPHFVIAQIAQKLKKKDEAIAEYQTYLKLDPEGEKAKEARRALAELQPSGSH